MMGFLLVAASHAVLLNGPITPAHRLCDTRSRGCEDNSDQRLRFRVTEPSRRDFKMDAYHIDARPCRLIGDMRCPGKTREIWRAGEPVTETLIRSFGPR